MNAEQSKFFKSFYVKQHTNKGIMEFDKP